MEESKGGSEALYGAQRSLTLCAVVQNDSSIGVLCRLATANQAETGDSDPHQYPGAGFRNHGAYNVELSVTILHRGAGILAINNKSHTHDVATGSFPISGLLGKW